MRPLQIRIRLYKHRMREHVRLALPVELATPLVDGSATGWKKRNLHRWTAVTRQLQAGVVRREGDRRLRAVVQERVRTCPAAS